MTEDQEKRLRAAETACITQRNDSQLWLSYDEIEPAPLQPPHVVTLWQGRRDDPHCDYLFSASCGSFEEALEAVLKDAGIRLG